MGNSKVIFGDETLIDLTGDTVTSDTLLAGTTAHNRSGEQIVGTATVPEELDDLTDVTLTSPADGDLLQYNATSQKWENSDTIPDELTAIQEAGAVNKAEVTFTSQVVGDVTYTVNSNKSIKITADSVTTGHTVTLTSYKHFEPGVYVLAGSSSASPGKVTLRIRASNGSIFVSTNDGTPVRFTVSQAVSNAVTLAIIAETQASDTPIDLTIYPMIYDARLVNPPYQPFTMTNRELTVGKGDASIVNELFSNLIDYDWSNATDSTKFAGCWNKLITAYPKGLSIGIYVVDNTIVGDSSVKCPPVSGGYVVLTIAIEPSNSNAQGFQMAVISNASASVDRFYWRTCRNGWTKWRQLNSTEMTK